MTETRENGALTKGGSDGLTVSGPLGNLSRLLVVSKSSVSTCSLLRVWVTELYLKTEKRPGLVLVSLTFSNSGILISIFLAYRFCVYVNWEVCRRLIHNTSSLTRSMTLMFGPCSVLRVRVSRFQDYPFCPLFGFSLTVSRYPRYFFYVVPLLSDLFIPLLNFGLSRFPMSF